MKMAPPAKHGAPAKYPSPDPESSGGCAPLLQQATRRKPGFPLVFGRGFLYNTTRGNRAARDDNRHDREKSHVRTTTEGGPLNNRIQDPALRELVRSLDGRLFKLLRETGALIEPSWQAR